jgi:polyisoprenoid-binding protein YceI
LTAAVAVLALATTAPADTFKFANSASKIEFTGTKKDGSHNGGFKKFAGTIDVSGEDFKQAKVSVEIQTDSLYSDNEKLTAHLKSPDFFDVRTFPTAKFVSKSIRATDGDSPVSHLIHGELTLHGVTKSVVLPVRVNRTVTGWNLNGTVTIQRKDFGMTFGEGQVNNDVTVTLTIQAGK